MLQETACFIEPPSRFLLPQAGKQLRKSLLLEGTRPSQCFLRKNLTRRFRKRHCSYENAGLDPTFTHRRSSDN